VLGSDDFLPSKDLAGQPVVINFWASWCVPCREEAPTLEQNWRKYKDQGVRFLGVNVQDSEDDARAFVEEFGITFPSVPDTDLKLWTKFGVRGLPETFFIDHSWTFVGIGSGRVLDNQGGRKILGAIQPAVLQSQIQILLERKKGDRR
jgi:cytochrome c biogenesis protein CcmG/thiol:disulfide interchange protein DsbE